MTPEEWAKEIWWREASFDDEGRVSADDMREMLAVAIREAMSEAYADAERVARESDTTIAMWIAERRVEVTGQ